MVPTTKIQLPQRLYPHIYMRFQDQKICQEYLPLATFSNSGLKICALIWTTVLGKEGQTQKLYLSNNIF